MLGLTELGSLNGHIRNLERTQASRDIEMTNTLERYSTAFATQETISQTMSERIEPLKSWMESSVASPLAEQLERVETSTRVSVTYSRQGSEGMRALSDAVSSMGSQLDRLQEMVSKGFEDTRSPKGVRLTFEYSCNAILGIEQAFVDDKCIYCGQLFRGVGPIDWRFRMMHLTKRHKFGSCASESLYASWGSFSVHLKEFHSAIPGKCQSDEFFRRPSGTAMIMSRELQLFSPDDILDELRSNDSYCGTEPSCLAELESKLQECLESIAELEIDSKSTELSQLEDPTLHLFWRLHWDLN